MPNFTHRGSSDRIANPFGKQLTVGAQVFKNRSIYNVERFLSLFRFEHREKLDGLQVGI